MFATVLMLGFLASSDVSEPPPLEIMPLAPLVLPEPALEPLLPEPRLAQAAEQGASGARVWYRSSSFWIAVGSVVAVSGALFAGFELSQRNVHEREVIWYPGGRP